MLSRLVSRYFVRDVIADVYRGMTGQTPDAEHLEELVEQSKGDGLAQAVTQVAESPAAFEAFFGRHRDILIERATNGDLIAFLLQFMASGALRKQMSLLHDTEISEVAISKSTQSVDLATRNLLIEAFVSEGNLSGILDMLAESMPLQRAVFSRIVDQCIHQLFRGLLFRAPMLEELDHFRGLLRGPEDLGVAVVALIAAQTTTQLGPAVSRLVHPADAVSGVIGDGPLESGESLRFGTGFYSLEDDFCWSSSSSEIVVCGDVTIYLACNYLQAGQQRVISVFDGHVTQTLVIDNAYGCHEIRFTGHIARQVTFNSDGAWCPQADGQGDDDRQLSFQLYRREPAEKFVHHDSSTAGSILLFVADDRKEIDSIQPIYKRMLAEHFNVLFVNCADAIHRTALDYPSIAGYVISSAATYIKLVNAGCRGSFIYLEHGVSPLKRYTYAAHYQRYDLLLMPGALWRDRIVRLYPELDGRCEVVGYAKLQNPRKIEPQARAAWCEKLGLDPGRQIILFAPSWSDGDERCGIFNLRSFDKNENVFTIPHDGDMNFAHTLREIGYRILRPATGESISDYYHLADVLVSDISSTAIEFASLGKPVICLALDFVPDFDMSYMDGAGRLRVPHSEFDWDFCEWAKPEELGYVLERVKAGSLDGQELKRRSERVKQWVDCAEEASVEKSVKAIEQFFKQKREASFPRKGTSNDRV